MIKEFEELPMLLSFGCGFVFVLRWRALESEDEANELRILKGSESEWCRWCSVENGVKGTVTMAALVPVSVVRRRMRREKRQMREKGQAAIAKFFFWFSGWLMAMMTHERLKTLNNETFKTFNHQNTA